MALLADDPKQHPVIDAVDTWLYESGGAMQIYHGECCCRRLALEFSFVPRQNPVGGLVVSTPKRHRESAKSAKKKMSGLN